MGKRDNVSPSNGTVGTISSLSPRSNFPVLLLLERGVPRKHAEEVVRWFERFPGPVSVAVEPKPIDLALTEDGVLLWSVAFARIQAMRVKYQVPEKHFVMLLTKSPNEDNWYAAQDETDMRNGFGHVGDFSWVTSAPASVITVHYILKGVFNALINERGIPWAAMWHVQPRGCLFDFCPQKWELNIKLRTADICGECTQLLRGIGIPDVLICQTVTLMEAARPLALNTAQYRAPQPEFDRWPFPVAVTRHKVVQATNPLLKFLLLLDHFDSLIRYFFLTHQVLDGREFEIESNPSLGWWVDQLAHSQKGEKQYREVVTIAQREGVVALRNELRGHGWMASDASAYQDEAVHLEKIIGNIEDELRPFLETYRLVIPKHVEPLDEYYVVAGENLVGSHLLHPSFEVRLTPEPRVVGLMRMNEVYVTDARFEKFHCMSPYIRSAICPVCHHDRVLVTDGDRRYIDVFMGHRVTL